MRPARIVAASLACALIFCVVIVGFQLAAPSLRGDAHSSGQPSGASMDSSVVASPAGEVQFPRQESIVPQSDALDAESSLNSWSPRVGDPPTRFIVDELNSDSSISADDALEFSPTTPLMLDEPNSPLDAPVLGSPRP